MTKIIRRTGSLLLACLLTIVLLCGPTAEAEGLLEAMTDISLRAGKTIEGTLRVEAGDLLALLGMLPAEAEGTDWVAVGDLLNHGLLRVRYTKVGEQDVLGMALELREEPVLSLDVRTRGEEIAMETSLLPGKTLIIPGEILQQAFADKAPFPQDDAWTEALAGAAERYGAVLSAWMAQNADMMTMREEAVPAIEKRDAAMGIMSLRVTDTQWQALLRALAEEFAKDDALRQALASQVGMDADAMAEVAQMVASSSDTPQGNAVQVDIFLGEGEEIVGFDLRLESPAVPSAEGSAQLHGSFAYGRRAIDADHAVDSYDAFFTWDEDSEFAAQLYRRDKVPSDSSPELGAEYGGQVILSTPETGMMEVRIEGNIRRTVEPVNEAYDHTIDLQLSQQPDDSGGTDSNALLTSSFALSSQTEVVGTEDFRSEGAFALELMGMRAAMRYTLASTDYTPAEHPEYIVLRLEELDKGELGALTQELEGNLQKLLGSPGAVPEATPATPSEILAETPGEMPSAKSPALQTYSVDDESVASIDSVVGFREITNSEAGITDGKPYVLVFYQSNSIQADLQGYLDFLLGSDWAATRLEGDASGGTIQMANEAAEAGKLLVVTIEFTADTYSVLFHKTGGTLRRYTDDAGNRLGEVTFTDGTQ